ncbi:MAG: GNAT family N-acetyltransferase [Oscillospiraceae bacterium]|nr:GNAT family N-acetyltransferase [Oscillospiraceae bacterium]
MKVKTTNTKVQDNTQDNKIVLRRLEDSDVRLVEKWLHVSHVAQWYHEPSEWIDEIKKRKSDYRWLHHFIAEHDGVPIGFCQYYEYQKSGETWNGETDPDGAYSIDYMIGDSYYLNKGYGKEMVKQLMEKIEKLSDSKRIIVQPDEENIVSCNTLISCGFQFDGTDEIYVLNFESENDQMDDFIF